MTDQANKNINVKIPLEAHSKLKVLVAADGTSQDIVIAKLIEAAEWPKPPKRTNRRVS